MVPLSWKVRFLGGVLHNFLESYLMSNLTNTIDDIDTQDKNLIIGTLEKFFLSFKDNSFSFQPVSYHLTPCYRNDKLKTFYINILYYAKPTIWFSSFSQDITGFAKTRYLSLPHRYTMSSSRVSTHSGADLTYHSSVITSDFLAFKKNDEKIIPFISSVPLSNHMYTKICTNYTVGSQLGYDLFDYYQDMFSHLVYSPYNSDYLNFNLHSSKSGYLLMKYLDFSDSDIDFSDYVNDISAFIKLAKKSKSYVDYAEKSKYNLRYVNVFSNLHNYDTFLDVWEATPSIWSDIPESEYRSNGFRNRDFMPRSLNSSLEIRERFLHPFLVSPILYNLDDLLSTLYV